MTKNTPVRMKKSEKELLDAVKSQNQVLILEKLAVIFTEDAIECSKRARATGNHEDGELKEYEERKMKNLVNLQKVNSDILRLQDKYKGEKAEPEEGSEEAKVNGIISEIPQL